MSLHSVSSFAFSFSIQLEPARWTKPYVLVLVRTRSTETSRADLPGPSLGPSRSHFHFHLHSSLVRRPFLGARGVWHVEMIMGSPVVRRVELGGQAVSPEPLQSRPLLGKCRQSANMPAERSVSKKLGQRFLFAQCRPDRILPRCSTRMIDFDHYFWPFLSPCLPRLCLVRKGPSSTAFVFVFVFVFLSNVLPLVYMGRHTTSIMKKKS
jgi:hypothetical protein